MSEHTAEFDALRAAVEALASEWESEDSWLYHREAVAQIRAVLDRPLREDAEAPRVTPPGEGKP